MSTGANAKPGSPAYQMLRVLGSRTLTSHAAIRTPHELVVAVRFVRVEGEARGTGARPGTPEGVTPLSPDKMTLLLRDANCLAKNFHPNIARVRHVDLDGADLTIASELIDGATLGDLLTAAAASRARNVDEGWAAEPLVDPAVLVRVLVDVLAGLTGLHGLREGTQPPLGVIHGELCPANIVVGRDGVARIVHALRTRPLRLGAGSEALGYAAPEALDVGGTDDARADVHAVGVILWEALAGRRLYTEKDPARILARQREEEIPAPAMDPGSPFAALGAVAMRAIAFDPALRFRTPAEMTAELRKIAGNHIASGSVVATWVATLAGERIRARRLELDPTSSGTRNRASERTLEVARAAATVDVSPQARPAAKPVADFSAEVAEIAAETAKTAARNAAKTAETAARTAETAENAARSECKTQPPTSLDPEDEPPQSQESEGELSLRDLMMSAPSLHPSSMVPVTGSAPPVPTSVLTAPLEARTSAPPLPPMAQSVPPALPNKSRLPPPLPRKAQPPPKLSPPPPEVASAEAAPSSAATPDAAAQAVAPSPAATPEAAAQATELPGAPLAPALAGDDEAVVPRAFLAAVWRHPKQRATVLLVGCAILLLLGGVFVVREVFADQPPPALPPSIPTALLPSTAVTAPPASATTETEGKGTR